MSIRIQNDGVAGAAASQVTQTGGPAQGTSATRAGSKTAPGADQVDLSSLSGAVASSLSAIASKQTNRVSQLAALYAKGQYGLDSAQISRSLISEAIGGGSIGGNS